MAVKTVRKLAAITATLHDGKNMIVLTKDRYARVSVDSLEFLREKSAIDETGEGPLDRDDDGAPGGSKEHEPPALKGKNKAQLLEIAAAEGAEVEDGASNADIVAAIELKREAVANGDEGGSDDAGTEGEAGAGETDGAGEQGDDGAPGEANGDAAP